MSDDSGDDGASESPIPDASYIQRKKAAQQRKKQSRRSRDEQSATRVEPEVSDDAVAWGRAAAKAAAAEVAADAASAHWVLQQASSQPGRSPEEAREAQQLVDREALIAAEFERITLKRQQAALAVHEKASWAHYAAAEGASVPAAAALVSPASGGSRGRSPNREVPPGFVQGDRKRDRKTPPRVLRASPGGTLLLATPAPAFGSAVSVSPVPLVRAVPEGLPSSELWTRQPPRPTVVQAAREALTPQSSRTFDASSASSHGAGVATVAPASPLQQQPLLPTNGDLASALERGGESPTLASLKAASLVARAKASLSASAGVALPAAFAKDFIDMVQPAAPPRRRWSKPAPPQAAQSQQATPYFVSLSDDGFAPQPPPSTSAASTSADRAVPPVARPNAAAVDASTLSPLQHNTSMLDLMRSSPPRVPQLPSAAAAPDVYFEPLVLSLEFVFASCMYIVL
jgi:hypothetical protein